MQNYIDDGNRIVELTTAVTDIRAEIKVDEAIFVKIYDQLPIGSTSEAYNAKKVIKSFNVIKTMLVNNSSTIQNFDEIVRELVDNPSILNIKRTSVDVIDCQSILSFINNILTIRVLHKVIISEQNDLFSKPLEKRKFLLKELETLYGTYKVDNDLISERAVNQLELYMTRSIAYCNTRRVFESLEFSPKNEKFLTSRVAKNYEGKPSRKGSDITSAYGHSFPGKFRNLTNIALKVLNKNNSAANNINLDRRYFVEEDTYSHQNKTSFRGSDN